MGRTLRMSTAEAIAAGLIDPDVADFVRARDSRATKSPAARGKKTQDEPDLCGSPKKKRSRSRPASHPQISTGPKGTGTVELLATGEIQAADFVFDVVPVPKERAQIVKNPKTGEVFGFTPARTKYFHDVIRDVVRDAIKGRPPITGPVKLIMSFVIAIPESWPAWKRDAALDGFIVPTGRPDMDNLEKALLDAFNGILIVDDAFVIERDARKIYGTLPSIRARVEQTGHFDIHVTRQQIELRRRILQENLT
ncbi:RusA family crossover junction endodeoxyribonuclease [Loktanella sp. DJP18]|uniref:RusA family crossover junction endodeoxyribonuclease n=1 Tax=Loktanella sp. DJP18 TaxID=3409788 RepID=UPI003BB7AB6A